MRPLPVPRLLAPCPGSPPRFSVSLKDSAGREFLLPDPRAARALVACMNMEAALGGAASHWGGPAAFAEIMSAVHGLAFSAAAEKGRPWFELFHIINDAGHCENGLYALKFNCRMAGIQLEDLKKFRSLEGRLAGHGELHLFPEGVSLSNGPLGSTAAQAQGLAMADRLCGRDRLCVLTMSDGACMEGEAKEALAAIPGFAAKGQIAPFLLIISDNNRKLSGPIDEDSFSLQPVFNSLKSLGWDARLAPRGNDLREVFPAVQKAFQDAGGSREKPIALVAKTIKGFGVKAAEESPSGGHGFPLKDPKGLRAFVGEIYGAAAPPALISEWIGELEARGKKSPPPAAPGPVLKKAQAGLALALTEQKERGLPIVSISSDLPGSTGAAAFRKKFPECSFDVGVAEANMISAAAGFSRQGFIPVVDTFAQFAVTKGSLPLLMASLSQAPVIGLFSHAGFQDAADGASHQSLSYIAQTCAIPRTDLHCLSSAAEARELLSQAIEAFAADRRAGKIPRTSLFFFGREVFPESLSGLPPSSYKLGQAQEAFRWKEGKDPVLIVSCGPLIYEALKAAESLKAKGRGAIVINSSSVSHPDTEAIARGLRECGGRLVTAEDHQISGGMSSLLISALGRRGVFPKKWKAIGVFGEFGRSARRAADLYRRYGMDSQAIAAAAESLQRS